MLKPFARAIAQLDDPAILGVLVQSLALAALGFAALFAGAFYGLHHEVGRNGWVSWIAGALGGTLATALALWLFLPVAVLIASLFLEPVCRAVERRWYPGLPAPAGASRLAQIWDGWVVGALVLVLSGLSLILAGVFPGVGLLLGWAITAWALGRGLFVAVAMRRMSRVEAQFLYRRHRGSVCLQGAALALAGCLPLVNLLLPVLGPACMVHVLMERRG